MNLPFGKRLPGWALYATNIYIAIYHTWLGTVDHLWSLAVEEQVYLFLPLLLFRGAAPIRAAHNPADDCGQCSPSVRPVPG